MSALTQLRHPHIVQYLGAVVEPPTHCIILEYCGGGDVLTALRAQGGTPGAPACHLGAEALA